MYWHTRRNNILPTYLQRTICVVLSLFYFLHQEVLRYVESVGESVCVRYSLTCWDRISRKWLEIETQLQWSTYRKRDMANQNGHVIDEVT